MTGLCGRSFPTRAGPSNRPGFLLGGRLMQRILQAEVIGDWLVDATVERQCVLMALKEADKKGCGDFRVFTATNGNVEVVYVRVYHT